MPSNNKKSLCNNFKGPLSMVPDLVDLIDNFKGDDEFILKIQNESNHIMKLRHIEVVHGKVVLPPAVKLKPDEACVFIIKEKDDPRIFNEKDDQAKLHIIYEIYNSQNVNEYYLLISVDIQDNRKYFGSYTHLYNESEFLSHGKLQGSKEENFSYQIDTCKHASKDNKLEALSIVTETKINFSIS